MNFIQVEAYWPNDYTDQEKISNTVIHGDDMNDWPDKDSFGPICFDLDEMCDFNPSYDDTKLRISLKNGRSFNINMTLHEFESILNTYEIFISKF